MKSQYRPVHPHKRSQALPCNLWLLETSKDLRYYRIQT
jgi:hypothetical protein